MAAWSRAKKKKEKRTLKVTVEVFKLPAGKLSKWDGSPHEAFGRWEGGREGELTARAREALAGVRACNGAVDRELDLELEVKSLLCHKASWVLMDQSHSLSASPTSQL